MYVIPANGLKVPDPSMQGMPPDIYFLPAEGREVADNDEFWQRRIADGEVTVGQAPGGGE